MVVFLLQIFIFDKLMLSIALLPMVYVAFIILLPMQTSRTMVLLWGALIGAIFDVAMGLPGVNSIATIFLAYVRSALLNRSVGRELVLAGGAPTAAKIGQRRFLRYMSFAVLIHSCVVYPIEYMNFGEWEFLLRRIIISSPVTMLFVWILSRRFEQVLLRRF